MKLITKLYNHQVKCVEKLKKIKIGALYMEMGTGKTRTALELIRIRLEKGRINHVLWLCPCSVKMNLLNDIIMHTGNDCKDLMTICGIETLSSSIKTNSELLKLTEQKECYLIVDESNLVKNFQAKRTKNIIALANNCKYKLILNGTPISKNETDLFAQWYILDWRVLGYKSFWSFSANHIEYNENIPGKLMNVLNVDYLIEKIAPYSYQVKKSECLDLPDKTYETVYFDLNDKQYVHYKYIKDIFLDQVDEFEETTIYRMFNALQHVLSGKRLVVETEEKKYSFMNYSTGMEEERTVRKIINVEKQNLFKKIEHNPRIQTLLEIVSKVNGKIIIFAKYTEEINNISSILNNIYGNESAVTYNGELNLTQRAKNIDKFKKDSRFLIANKNCAGYGLNLQFCNYIIYYSNDWDYATRIQSEDRVHRIGQSKNVHIIDICANNKFEERILECLFRKENLIKSLKEELEKQKDTRNAFDSWINVPYKTRNGKVRYKNKKITSIDKKDLIIEGDS